MSSGTYPRGNGGQGVARLAFVAKASDIRLLGPRGFGKTHLAVALTKGPLSRATGPTSCELCEFMNLVEGLRKARAEHNLSRRMKVYPAHKVLFVDEFGI